MSKYVPGFLPAVSDLQRDLIEEIEEVLKDIETKKPSGEVSKGIKGFAQGLPKSIEYENDPSMVFPYFIVRMADGETSNGPDSYKVTLSVIIGLHNDDEKNTGHYDMLDCIQAIINHFSLAGNSGRYPIRARVNENVKWALQDEDTWPYFFGGVELEFTMPKYRREDPFSYGY